MLNQVHPTEHAINGIFSLPQPSELKGCFRPDIKVSFEVFPESSTAGRIALLNELRALMEYQPEYISVTYGAGGNNRGGSIETSKEILRLLDAEVMSHLTFSGQVQAGVMETAEALKKCGVQHVLALRGDAYDRNKHFPGRKFANTVEFIKSLKEQGWCSIKTTAYPDIHKDAESEEQDFNWLLKKFDAGASEAITQFFFDADSFFRLRDRLDKYGLANKLVPGILAFRDVNKVFGFAEKCGVKVPASLKRNLYSNNTEPVETRCLSVLTDLCIKLSAEGVRKYHFYTLNKANPTRTLLELLMRTFPIRSQKPAYSK